MRLRSLNPMGYEKISFESGLEGFGDDGNVSENYRFLEPRKSWNVVLDCAQ